MSALSQYLTLSATDLAALWITLRLALLTTAILLVIGTPLAWWLARSRMRVKPVIEAIVALPLVLPPTVLGFYLLIALGPHGPIGATMTALGARPAAVKAFWIGWTTKGSE